MSGLTGREGNVAFAKFATNSWGVAASVLKGAYFESDGGLAQTIEYVEDESFGQRFRGAAEPGNFPAVDITLTQSGKYGDHSYILDALAMGSPNAVNFSTSFTGAVTSWLHVIDLAASTDGLGATFAFDKVIHVDELTSAKVRGFSVTGDSSVIKFAYKLTGDKSTNTSSINTRSTVNGANFPGLTNRMLIKNGTFRANLASGNTLAVGDALPIEGCDFQFERPQDAPAVYGQDYVYEPADSGFPDASLSVTFPRMNTAAVSSFYALHRTGTQLKGELRFEGALINSTDKHSCILQFPALEVQGTTQAMSGATQVKPTVMFKVKNAASSVSGMPFTWPFRMRRLSVQSVAAF